MRGYPRAVRVALDEQIFLLQRHGGVSRYFVHLIGELTRDPSLEADPELPFRRVWNDHAVAELGDKGVRRGPRTFAPYPMLAAAWGRPARRGEVDIVHHTFYHPRFLRDFPGALKVSTMHDMIPEKFPDLVPAGVHMAKERYYRESDLILFPSQSSERDLVDWYGDPGVPTVVAHHGVERSFFEGGSPVAGFPSHYVLFVGRRGGYKDFDVLLTAFAAIASGYPDLSLVALGGDDFTDAERASITSLNLTGRVIQQTVTDRELPGAYANARLFVMPSRYEGFGLPVLESMAAGAPVVAADTSSLPEVGGHAAVYFPPGDVDVLSDRLAALLGDDTQLSALREQGTARAATFTWRRQSEATAAAYHLAREIANG